MCKILSKLYDIINTEKKIENKNEQKICENNEIMDKNINLGKNNSNKKIDYSNTSSKSKNNSKNSDNEFDYSDSLIDIIEEENRNTDENISENIIKNNSGGKNYKLDLSDNKKNDKDIKFLNNKRRLGFEDLMNNLKNKVTPIKDDDDIQFNFNPNELNFEK